MWLWPWDVKNRGETLGPSAKRPQFL